MPSSPSSPSGIRHSIRIGRSYPGSWTLMGMMSRRDYAREDLKAVVKARLVLTDAVARKRNSAMADALGVSGNSPVNREKRSREDGLRLASAVGKEVVKEHARWRGEMSITPLRWNGWALRHPHERRMSVINLRVDNSRQKGKSCVGIRFVPPRSTSSLRGRSSRLLGHLLGLPRPRKLWTPFGRFLGKWRG